MKKLLFVFLFVFLLSIASAEVQTLGYFKQGTDVNLFQTCDACSYVNISYVALPNTTYIVQNQAMTKSGYSYSYSLISNYTQDFGRYLVCGFGDDGGTATTWCYDFYINSTGRPEPSGSIVVLFVIIFLIILAFLIYMFVFSLGHAIKKDFDFVDFALNFGIYASLLGFYIFQKQYLGNPTIEGVTEVLVIVGAVTHVVASGIFLFISLVWSNMEQQRRASGTVK